VSTGQDRVPVARTQPANIQAPLPPVQAPAN
jgi:hypothetical protein